jgi:hypothetical protein
MSIDDVVDDDEFVNDPDAEFDDGENSDDLLEPAQIASPQPLRSLRSGLRDAFNLRKQAESQSSDSTSGTVERSSATATLRSSRASQAPIDEAYLLRLLSFPDLLNPSLMTLEENRLLERLVVQLQLQLQR